MKRRGRSFLFGSDNTADNLRLLADKSRASRLLRQAMFDLSLTKEVRNASKVLSAPEIRQILLDHYMKTDPRTRVTNTKDPHLKVSRQRRHRLTIKP